MTPCTGHGGRGCPCPAHEKARVYHRVRTRRIRDTRLEAEQLRAGVCPRRSGPGVCRGQLETWIDGSGRTRVRCLRCERRRRGICRDCPARVEGAIGLAQRCAECKRKFRNECCRRWAEAHHDLVLHKSRDYYRSSAEIRARRNEQKRLWRKLNPEKVAEHKRRYIAKHSKNPNSAYNRYYRRYRRRYRYHNIERNHRIAAQQPRRPVPKCKVCGRSTRWTPIVGVGGRPWLTCAKHTLPRERMRRRLHRARARREALARRVALPPPALIKRPPRAAVRGPGNERLCVGSAAFPRCDTVMSHRRKKCTRCWDSDRRAAAEASVHFAGRGRRTDLERRRERRKERVA